LTSCLMVSRLSGVYLLSFCLIGLNDRSILNLCSITSLGIPGISDIFHAKTIRMSRIKVKSTNSYLGLRLSLIWSFLSGLLGSTTTSLSSVPRVPFSLLSAFQSTGNGIETDVILVPFAVGGTRGELPMGGLDPDALLGVSPPSNLVACNYAALSSKRLTCDNEAFSHASASL
jgi:hypothetical protein